VVPVKSRRHAKSRLAPVLDEAERVALVEHMLTDVLGALHACARVSGVVVVTPDPEIATVGRARGAVALEEAEAGLNRAIRQARELLAERGATAMMVLPGDLPLLTPEAVDRLLDALPRAPAVVLAPDTERAGTNALLCAPSALIDPAFGPDSFGEHASRARESGVEPVTLELSELALDLDEPADLGRLLRGARVPTDPSLGTCRTIRYLVEAGIATRLAAAADREPLAPPGPATPDR
jgi:2-phospho-L-lactate guanylyltransferase